MNTTKKPRKKKSVILPMIPSKLIRLALRDLRKCEAQPDKFEIKMTDWITVNSHCTVCLAGAVMVQRLDGIERTEKLGEGNRTKQLQSYQLPLENRAQLLALDYFRCGCVGLACEFLGRTTAVGPAVLITPYTPSPKNFHQDMLLLARELEKEGN